MKDILHQAEELEKKYDWLGAAESYKKALNLLPEDDFSKKGGVTEQLGYALYRASFQAETNEEFRERMLQASVSHERAKESYTKTQKEKAGEILRCDAMIALIGYWLSSEAQKKKEQTIDCWALTKRSLEDFRRARDARAYGKTYNHLSICVDLGFFFEWKFQARETLIEEAIERGELAINFLSDIGDPFELAAAYLRTATFLEMSCYYFVVGDNREMQTRKIKDYVQRSRELSEEAFMSGLSSVLFGSGPGGFWADGSEDAINNLEEALTHVKRTKDRFLIGCTVDLLTYHIMWLSTTYYDLDEMLKHLEEAMRCNKEAKCQFCLISFISPRGGGLWVEGPYSSYYRWLAGAETDMSRRRGFLEKALLVAPEELRRAENSGYPDIIWHEHWMYNGSLWELAKMTANSFEKRELLEKALEHIGESCRITEQIESPGSWNANVIKYDRAVVKSELAGLARDNETKKTMLQEAIIDMQASLKILAKTASDTEEQGSVALFSHVAPHSSSLGDLWIRLHEISRDNEQLLRAIEAFVDAAESYEKIGAESRVAECFWKAARAYGNLGNHLKAAEKFEASSENYSIAGEKIQRLKDFYGDYANYMKAWYEIEEAKHHHARQEYGLAKEHFEKAAGLHKSLKQWMYLESNYSAWALVENAEELSRKEQTEEAAKAFEDAAKRFAGAKKSVQAQLCKIEDKDEKQMAANVVKASSLRKEYCEGRIALEQARMLDKNGDHYSSSEKFGSAADAFETIGHEAESEQDRKELQLITSLSRAWQKMTLAETKSSPPLYSEASQIFEQAEDLSPNEKTKLLLLGHSRFCKALEAGTGYADTRNPALHKAAEQQLESAANYYVKAGFQNASEYSKAMEHLFDAYLCLDDAKSEKNPEKKARLYVMAERVLQASANSFMKAQHPEKHEQVQRLLEKVKEERELAFSLSEVFHAPLMVSTTAVFNTLGPTHENAVGLEKFEHADVRAKIIVNRDELKVGESLDLEIELANPGKGQALLTRIEGVIPEGFELTNKPEPYRVKDSNIDLKGRRLDPLKVEELRLTLRPKRKGSFRLKPLISYIDENGNPRSHKPKPQSIKVTQLILPNRIATGYQDLDDLLFGGIPQNSAVILASPSYDWRDLLVNDFLETGAKKGDITFYLTISPGSATTLVDRFPSSFRLFICNPQAGTIVKDAPNVIKLNGVENLTDIQIALTSSIRKLDPSLKSSRRICLELVSDVLLQHHAVQTRRWLNTLILELKSNDFTTVAIVDPQMHPSEEIHAILGLFDGEIDIYEKGVEQFLKIKRMSNQKYLENELLLKKKQL